MRSKRSTYTFRLACSVEGRLLLWYTLRWITWSGGLIRKKEVSRTNQLQDEAGILRNVWLCEGENVTSDSAVQQPAPPRPL